MHIRISRSGRDDPPPHIELSISSRGFAAQQDSYIDDEQWLDFGKALQSFPQSLDHEVVFESGSPDPLYHDYIRLRAFVYDGVGHAAMEVRMENHSAPPYTSSAHFHVLCDAAVWNHLGQLLESWAQSKESEFEFSTSVA
jgi:hypothetical protein